MRNIEQNQSLRLWFEALASSVRGEEPDLSARQMVILLTVYLNKGPHTVRGLSENLMISKPAVTRALDQLADFGYITRQKDLSDRRSVLIKRTEAGDLFLDHFADKIRSAKRKLDLG